MQQLTFEFESEKEMRDVIKKLWDQHGVTGEMHSKPLNNGRWRLEMLLEKELRESTLEKFAQYRVEAGD